MINIYFFFIINLILAKFYIYKYILKLHVFFLILIILKIIYIKFIKIWWNNKQILNNKVKDKILIFLKLSIDSFYYYYKHYTF